MNSSCCSIKKFFTFFWRSAKFHQHTLPYLKVILIQCHTFFTYAHKVNILRYVISYLPHPSDRNFYLRNYPEICSGGRHARWQKESNIRGTGRKRSRHTWDPKTCPEYGNFLLGYTISGRKKSKSGRPVQNHRRFRVAFDIPPPMYK